MSKQAVELIESLHNRKISAAEPISKVETNLGQEINLDQEINLEAREDVISLLVEARAAIRAVPRMVTNPGILEDAPRSQIIEKENNL